MAKRSRRARRQVKQKQAVSRPPIKDEAESRVEVPESPEVVEETPIPRNLVNFAREYFYVYTELRNILVVAIIMFIVMTGLAFFV